MPGGVGGVASRDVPLSRLALFGLGNCTSGWPLIGAKQTLQIPQWPRNGRYRLLAEWADMEWESSSTLLDDTCLRRVIHHRNLTQRPLLTFPAWRLRVVGPPPP